MNLDEALHPPDYQPRPLNIILLLSGVFGRIQPLALTPAWAALVAVSCWPWDSLRVPAAVLSALFLVADGVSLAMLPRFRRSFGPVTPPLLALTLLRGVITFAGGLLLGTLPTLVVVASVQTTVAIAAIYATWIEPFKINVTQASLSSPKLRGSRPLRILHISDIHVEQITRREERLLDLVEALSPDLIVLTGDYLNLSSVRDPLGHHHARELLRDLCTRASCPVYAITGSPPVDLWGVVPEIFEGLGIEWLMDDLTEVTVRDQSILLAGLQCTRDRKRDATLLRNLVASAPNNRFVLLLYHSPDLMPKAVELGIDLYLCGHTHGGQLRLPFYGALVTSSDFGKRYEMGHYEEGDTTMYVSRGLGVEGLGAPRARFLSPPEVILWTVTGDPH